MTLIFFVVFEGERMRLVVCGTEMGSWTGKAGRHFDLGGSGGYTMREQCVFFWCTYKQVDVCYIFRLV